MEHFTTSNLVIFAALVVPGFLSMKVFSLFHPRDRVRLKDDLLEAVAFGIVNFALLSWPIARLAEPGFSTTNPFQAYFLIVVVFFVAPVLWPVVLNVFLNWLSARRIILERSQTAWDNFFLRREVCWVLVHLGDGRRIGGWFGENSYASLYPDSGHLYLEQLWRLDDQGAFLEAVEGSQGIVLRPDDYHMIEMFKA